VRLLFSELGEQARSLLQLASLYFGFGLEHWLSATSQVILLILIKIFFWWKIIDAGCG